MRELTLKSGRKVKVSDAMVRRVLQERAPKAAGMTDEQVRKIVTEQMSKARKPAAVRTITTTPQPDPYVSAAINELTNEVRRLQSVVSNLKTTAAPDISPALRQLGREFLGGVDRIVEAVKAPVSVVRDANGKPIGAKRG